MPRQEKVFVFNKVFSSMKCQPTFIKLKRCNCTTEIMCVGEWILAIRAIDNALYGYQI